MMDDQLENCYALILSAAQNKAAALSAFSQFDTIPFVLSTRCIVPIDRYFINPKNKTIEIKSYNYFKEFINIFGHMVKEVRVEIDKYSTFNPTSVFNYISKHCTSLKELRFYQRNDVEYISNHNVDVMIKNPLCITKPLPSVETLSTWMIYFKSGMKLDACFPNLQTLYLSMAATSDPSFIEVAMPKLTKMYFSQNQLLDGYVGGQNLKFKLNNVEQLIRMNPQLGDVNVSMNMDISFVKFLRDSLPSLQKLSLAYFDFGDYYGEDVVLKNLHFLKLLDLSHIDMVPPLTSDNLCELMLMAGKNGFAFEYIKKHRSLKVLRLECEYNGRQLLGLIKSLENLEAIYLKIEGQQWATNNVIRLLAECERINIVHGYVRIETTQQSWQPQLTNIWKIDKITRSIYRFKKNTFA